MLHRTGTFITEAEMADIQRTLSSGGTLEIRSKGIVITTPAKVLAMEKLAALAVAYGLPKLAGQRAYGLAADREIVWKD